EQWLSKLIQDLKEWWMILSQKNKADRNCAKLKEIQKKISNRCELIDGKQGKKNISKSFGQAIYSKLNFKIAKALEKLNIFYINQLILQDGTMLATWGQLKLIKNATRKERKPIWFRHLELIILQDTDTRKIKDDLSTDANLKELAIPTLQRLSSDNRVKDWVIAKEINSEPTLGHIVKKNSKLNPLQEFCTLRLSKKRILGALPKGALEPLTKITKIKSNLWQRVQNKQQSNPESVLFGLKNLEIIELMSVKDLELELNKIKGHSGNKWNDMIDSIAKKGALDNNVPIVDFQEILSLRVSLLWKDDLIDSPIRKMLQTIEKFTIGVKWLYSSQIQDLKSNPTNTNYLWPNL
ncbi:40998_t:CDS:2, partial [Gigaspora margarita]